MTRRFFVPGRIEVLGKHTDYAGGRSLLCAVERGFRVSVTPRADEVIHVTDTVTGASDRFALDPDVATGAPPGHWSLYPRVVARRVARNFPSARHGAEIAFESDLPSAAGLSSSSAFMIAIFLALDAANGLQAATEYTSNISCPEDLATYLASVENGSTFRALAGDRGVGTFGGSEDHTAILCCRPNTISVYLFCPARLEQAVPLPPGYVFAIGSSGVAARKTGGAMRNYNRAAAQTAELLHRWNTQTGRQDPSLAAALTSSPAAADEFRAMLPRDDALLERLEQFIEESQVLAPAAADAIGATDLNRFGSLIDRSQQLAEGALGNQVPETIALARSARALGAVAASAFGAGFGGSVWALVRRDDADGFLGAWANQYGREFRDRAADARFFITGAGGAAAEV